jgi:isoleucyl-tRNA synthetase
LPEGIAKDYVASRDIFDVWFESGMVHDYVGRQQDQNAVADIYVEGSDQHRGWFQSSLLTSVALYDEAPYKTVMTHGFVLDEKGEKMSKSLGNTQSMEECIGNFGNDVMRIWVLSSDFTEEIRFGTQSMERAKEIYKTIRNRLKFLLSVLNGQEQQQIQCESMPFLEKYIFARIFYLQQQINEKLHSYLYRDIFTTLMDFLNNDLSKIYFFSRKDTLYCDDKNSCHRKISIFTMGTILKFLLYNFSFMLPFMTEETWMVYNQEALEINRYKQESVHLMEPFIPTAICDHEAIIETMNKITKIGDEIMQKVEIAIKNQIVKSYNEAVIHLPTNDFAKDHKEIIKEVYKIADLIIHHNVEDIIVSKTTNKKCARCWNFVIDHSHSNELCDRCEKVLNRNISQ